MPPDVQLDPDALRTAAAAAAALAESLPLDFLGETQVEACLQVEGGPALLAEHDRILAVLRVVRRELTELAVAGAAAASGWEDAERNARRLVERAGGGLT